MATFMLSTGHQGEVVHTLVINEQLFLIHCKFLGECSNGYTIYGKDQCSLTLPLHGAYSLHMCSAPKTKVLNLHANPLPVCLMVSMLSNEGSLPD